MPDQTPNLAHGTHDLELIAGLAAGDLAGSETAQAEALMASCADCGLIVEDLRAIAASIRGIGSAFADGGAPAPRDFRLKADDVARLKRRSLSGSGWRSMSPSWMRGAGVALATFGLVGVLISAVPLNFLGAGGTAAAPSSAGTAGPAPASAGNDLGYTEASLGPQQPAPDSTPPAVKASSQPERNLAVGGVEAPATAPALNLVTAAGAGALVIGIGLILGSRRNRRSGP